MLYCRLLMFFKFNFFEKLFQEYHLSVEQIGSRTGPTFCLQWLSADGTQYKAMS